MLPTQVASSYIVESLNIFLSNINGDSKGSLPKMFLETKRLLIAAVLMTTVSAIISMI